MTKKRRPVRRKQRSSRADARKLSMLLGEAQASLLAGRNEDAIQFCQALLAVAPPRSRQRVEALAFLANAQAVLKRFDEAYETLLLATKLAPHDSYLWHNWGLAALYTSRSGEAVLHLRRAVALEGAGSQAQIFANQLAIAEEIAEEERASRGDDFTLTQLIEQQTLYKAAFILFEDGDYSGAEAYFHRVIELGDSLPQPWGNLGICLLMQRRYDEAEAAFSRALEIDPGYDLARQNLKKVGLQREADEIPEKVVITSPFEQQKVTLRMDYEE